MNIDFLLTCHMEYHFDEYDYIIFKYENKFYLYEIPSPGVGDDYINEFNNMKDMNKFFKVSNSPSLYKTIWIEKKFTKKLLDRIYTEYPELLL